ncbi:MAG: Lrp/AsnC ligand binding domain-containing protein [Anaerolineae bacterium]|nr:Lrp/AsnC ligand binding domain-containing protein [Anaerolineae bacterium]
METWAYIFISTRYPKRTLSAVRGIAGVIHADALFGSPDIIAIVKGDDIAAMDAVIDRIAELPDVAATDSKVARWLDQVGPPRPADKHNRPEI